MGKHKPQNRMNRRFAMPRNRRRLAIAGYDIDWHSPRHVSLKTLHIAPIQNVENQIETPSPSSKQEE